MISCNYEKMKVLFGEVSLLNHHVLPSEVSGLDFSVALSLSQSNITTFATSNIHTSHKKKAMKQQLYPISTVCFMAILGISHIVVYIQKRSAVSISIPNNRCTYSLLWANRPRLDHARPFLRPCCEAKNGGEPTGGDCYLGETSEALLLKTFLFSPKSPKQTNYATGSQLEPMLGTSQRYASLGVPTISCLFLHIGTHELT